MLVPARARGLAPVRPQQLYRRRRRRRRRPPRARACSTPRGREWVIEFDS